MKKDSNMKEGLFDTPILYLMFNRPDLVAQTFPQIQKVKPRHLFVAADGPRNGNENDAKKCQECRDWVMSQIDWECGVQTLFRDENLGCGLAVSGAITWFFEHVEMGIILEDDIVVGDSFFRFQEDMLVRYKDTKAVMHVTGLNWINDGGSLQGKDSYYFSKYPGIWGWGTWADSWNKFDYHLDGLNEFISSNRIAEITRSKSEQSHHISTFLESASGRVDTWDYQWKFSLFVNRGVCIWPGVNLSSNIGFGSDATHTSSSSSWRAGRSIFHLPSEYVHPRKVFHSRIFDQKTAMKIFVVKSDNLFIRMKRLLLTLWFSFIPNNKKLENKALLHSTIKRKLYEPGNHIFIACFPKSGSTFLANALKEVTGYEFVIFVSAFGQNEHDIYEPKMIDHYEVNTVTHQHARATDANIQILKRSGIKPIVLVRSIFDVVVSMRDHLINENIKWSMAHVDKETFFLFNKKEQYDFIIDLMIPWYFNFYCSWVSRKEQIEYMLITYESFIANKVATIKRVMKFTQTQFKESELEMESLIQSTIGEGREKSRLNRGVVGRGSSELDANQKARIRKNSDYYKGIDFTPIGL